MVSYPGCPWQRFRGVRNRNRYDALVAGGLEAHQLISPAA